MRVPAWLLVLLGIAAPAWAQRPTGSPLPAGDELVVDLLTVGPGPAVWELWGHNTIIITDQLHGTSTSYNWGLFDFRQENFLLRFVQGRMWYAMGGRSTERELAMYRRGDRSMRLQRLDLTPAQRAALRDSLLANDTDARRNYFYDYYRDNCSTRVRDALDLALGGALARQFEGVGSGATWRWETRRITSGNLLLYLGIMLGEGRTVDAGMSRWEQMFLPLRLAEAAREVTLTGSGDARRLVAAEEEVYRSTRYAERAAPGVTWPWLVGSGVLGGFVLAMLGRSALRERRARLAFGALATTWSLVAGVGSLVLLGLWLLTNHAVSTRNANILLLTPLSLALAVLLPLALRLDSSDRLRRAARTLAWLAVIIAVLAAVFNLLPQLRQGNAELIGMIVPLHAGLAWGLSRATSAAQTVLRFQQPG